MRPILKPILDWLDTATLDDVRELSAVSGIPYHTLTKLKRGETTNPRVSTVEALLPYLPRRIRAARSRPLAPARARRQAR